MKQNKLNTDLNSRLKGYAVLAGAAVATSVGAQIEHTTVDPNMVIDEVGDYYDLDLNNDGVVDFKIKSKEEVLYDNGSYSSAIKGVSIEGVSNLNKIKTTYGNIGDTPFVVNQGESITFGKTATRAYLYGEINYNYYGTNNSLKGGLWNANQVDKFIGLSIVVGSQTYYGWVKLDFTIDTETIESVTTVKEYGYNAIAGIRAIAGLTTPEQLPAVSNIIASDISDNFNITDLKVTFDKAADETNIIQYLALIFKADQIDQYTNEMYYQEPEFPVVAITADGSDSYEYTYKLGDLDALGNPIELGEDYIIKVVSLGDLALVEMSNANSNTISLSASTSVISGLTVSDVSDNGNASDLSVAFSKAADESNVSEYRIYIVPGSSVSTFDAAAATLVTDENNYQVVTIGADFEQVLSSSLLCYNGSSVTQNANYYIFVGSVLTSDGSILLSVQSHVVKTEVLAPIMSNIEISDERNSNHNSYDLNVSFDVPLNLTGIGSYMYVSFVRASEFNNYTEEDLLNNKYWSHPISNLTAGNSYNLSYLGMADINGDNLVEGVEYYGYIISSAASLYSESRTETVAVKITSPLSAQTSVIAVNMYENYDASDILIMADKVSFESKVSEYRILGVKAADVASFNLEAANAVQEGNYQVEEVVLSSGPGPLAPALVAAATSYGSLSVSLTADFKDIDGEALVHGELYKFFILNVGNETTDQTNTLSVASNNVQLPITTQADKTALGANQVYVYDNALHINIEGLSNSAKLSIFDISGKLLLIEELTASSSIISLSGVSQGVKVVKIVDGNKVFTAKVMNN